MPQCIGTGGRTCWDGCRMPGGRTGGRWRSFAGDLTPDGRQRLANHSPWDASPGAEPAPYFPGELTTLEAEVLPLIT